MIRALAPFVDLAAPTKYADIFPPVDPDYHPTAVAQSMFMQFVDRDVATAILERLAATACAHRTSRIMAAVRGAYPGGTRDRLTAIKYTDDPTNVLRRNQNLRSHPAR